MEISKTVENTVMNVVLDGRLDTLTAPVLDAELRDSLGEITELVFDFAKLAYISSAGLRVLLTAQKVMNKQGEMLIRNVNSEVKEVFDVTGFSDILKIV
mgnify:CR=1 FL=1